jgi:hypothetical protein
MMAGGAFEDGCSWLASVVPTGDSLVTFWTFASQTAS